MAFPTKHSVSVGETSVSKSQFPKKLKEIRIEQLSLLLFVSPEAGWRVWAHELPAEHPRETFDLGRGRKAIHTASALRTLSFHW